MVACPLEGLVGHHDSPDLSSLGACKADDSFERQLSGWVVENELRLVRQLWLIVVWEEQRIHLHAQTALLVRKSL